MKNLKKILASVLVLSSLVGFSVSVASFASEKNIEQVLNTKIVIGKKTYDIKVPIKSFRGKDFERDENGKAWLKVMKGFKYIPLFIKVGEKVYVYIRDEGCYLDVSGYYIDDVFDWNEYIKEHQG